ncbi:lipid II:glycine glycyltransferase FemX [Paenibacillus cymbidii]|uniref:lipid II:glycine glycyltransferase FemX n=1 Tax=Paenibacillus cymbidii TaxID=1639034 RepID=UPI001436A42C|nr:GNAT family N-acetyltransferase [Paenibacillus cymbidii]
MTYRYAVVGSAEPDRWGEALDRVCAHDVYATSSYCDIYEKNGEGSAKLFVYEQEDRIVVYPFLLRPLAGLPAYERLAPGEMWYDASTPYGYGGPLTNETDLQRRKELLRQFDAAFDRYCRETRIVSEFVRFHPLLPEGLDYEAVQPAFVRNTIAIDLRGSEEDILAAYSRDNRNRIRRALKEGLAVVRSDPRRMDNLLALYYGTMDKKEASDYYYFSETFFRNTVDFLAGRIELFEVTCDGRTIASALFMHGSPYAHYHLMGSDKAYLRFAPINLLIHTAAMWLKSIGCTHLHLGGGYTGNDNLYRFKRSFNEREAVSFHVGTRVRDADKYRLLAANVPGAAAAADGYFPAYRRIAEVPAELAASE